MNIELDKFFDHVPDFQGHEQAREWFKSQFKDRFLLRNSDVINGMRIYYYHIVKNPETYRNYMEGINNEGHQEFTSSAPFESYSTVEISENGDISFTL